MSESDSGGDSAGAVKASASSVMAGVVPGGAKRGTQTVIPNASRYCRRESCWPMSGQSDVADLRMCPFLARQQLVHGVDISLGGSDHDVRVRALAIDDTAGFLESDGDFPL